MVKSRKAYYKIEKALNSGAYRFILLMGLRKVGKTTILKQLAYGHGGYYVDFRASNNPEQDFSDVLKREEKLILLDEIGYLPGFDACLESAADEIFKADKKVVLTGSSYGALKQLGREKLSGCSEKIELFPLDFEEYLYFSGRISWYGEDCEPAAGDVHNYYRLEGVADGMRLVFDHRYMEETFNGIEAARANYRHAVRDVFLMKEQHSAVIDILVYSLKEQLRAARTGNASPGFNLSNDLISYAGQLPEGMDSTALARIIAYLVHAGFLFADLKVTEGNKQNNDRIVSSLLDVRGRQDLRAVLGEYTLNVISPLLYTRLGLNLEGIPEELYNADALPEQLYRLAVKSESVYRESSYISHSSYKYTTADARIDLISYSRVNRNGLLLETPFGFKSGNGHYANKIFRDAEFIRVLTDEPGTFEFNGVFHRIGYPKALLLMSNGNIYNLKAGQSPESDELSAANKHSPLRKAGI